VTNFANSAISCGVKMLVGVSYRPPKEGLVEAIRALYVSDGGNPINHFGMILFSDTVRNHGGTAYAEYITENKLGSIIESKIITNPNSCNKIRTWIWHVNKRGLGKWYKENNA
jgi:hypothetical protein